MTPQLAAKESLAACIDLVRVLIWLNFSRRALQDFRLIAFLMLTGLVTVKSSLTIWKSKVF
jgi:hypothetical protein